MLYLFTGLKRLKSSEPLHDKRLQGAVDVRRRAFRRTILYFKCPATKQMRYTVDAYSIGCPGQASVSGQPLFIFSVMEKIFYRINGHDIPVHPEPGNLSENDIPEHGFMPE